MANEELQNPESTKDASSGQATGIDGGNYELIRGRLVDQGKALQEKTDEFDERRKAVFGHTELSIIGQHSIHTEDKRLPRDMIAVGDQLLFGYHVLLGMRREVQPKDFFSLHSFDFRSDGDFDFPPISFENGLYGALNNPDFRKHFQDLHQFSKSAKLLSLREVTTSDDNQRLLATFQVSERLEDVRVFRWNILPSGELSYLDSRGDRDNVYPPPHAFEWTETNREDFVEEGPHPHVSIKDKVFVETIGGDLTIKIEDNTTDGLGIYNEPVDEENQTLNDGKILYYEEPGGSLILLKILPYREKTWRYFVFNTRTKGVARLDAIGQACVTLPKGHGFVFPGGYYLQSGDYKTFDTDITDLIFKEAISSYNGEDFMYVFHHVRDGRYVLLPYNLIRREAQNPIECHGYSIFEDGRMVVFRGLGDKPETIHPIRVWQTPFTTAKYAASIPNDGSFISKMGNPELASGISDVRGVYRLINNQEPTRLTYEDLITACNRTIDSYYWLKEEETGGLFEAISTIRHTAELIVGEFEKIIAFRKRATEALEEAEEKQRLIFRELRTENYTRVEQFLEGMTQLRKQQGHLSGVKKDVRFVNVERIKELIDAAVEQFDRVSRDCIQFLLRDEAMDPLIGQLDELLRDIEAVEKVRDIEPLSARLLELNEGLSLLSETVANIEVDDTTIRTQILESITEVFSHLNRVRATLQIRRKSLLSREGKAEFAAQFKLFGQSVSSALSIVDTPERYDEQLTKLLLQLGELEGKFSEFDEFLEELLSKREEVTEAISTRKQALLDERQRRVQNLLTAADRILNGIKRRASTFKTDEELNAYFASDPMVLKLNKVSQQLLDLDNSVKSDELLSRLKSAQQDALRGLRDRLELFEDGANIIKLGKHRFSVNTQNLDLTLVPRGEGQMALHLTGTDFYELVEDVNFLETQPFWSQQIVSENKEVYRSEFLCAQLLFAAEEGRDGLSINALNEAMRSEKGLLGLIRDFTADRYDESYERGQHDVDAVLILEKLLVMRTTAGLLRFASRPRSMACLFWASNQDKQKKDLWHRRSRSFGRLRQAFAHSPALLAFAEEMSLRIATFYEEQGLEFEPGDERTAGRYLIEELTQERPHFTTSAEAEGLRDTLLAHLERQMVKNEFEEDMKALERDLTERYQLAQAWLEAFINSDPEHDVFRPILHEAVVIMLTVRKIDRQTSSAMTSTQVTGLLGQHKRINEDRSMPLRLDEFLSRLSHFVNVEVPGFRNYRQRRAELVERDRRRLRIDEFLPRVMTSFVRNKLINDVYLHMVGDNLAKQMGALGDGKRTDLMGLLLLISPPGYGKTTLMEYVANRLGLVFMKVNGPSLGHHVVSIDPEEAPNATARQEVEKINLALEMGNNVMLYLDDIQHTNPELLQKFISLCDGQRKIEGIWRGRTRTYDMRGKKFCVVMAGNPYTETGEKFRIPDMLANRADTYNLGDVLSGKDREFALSYIENALTSNAALAPLSTRETSDTYKLIRMAQGEEIASTDLKHGYSGVELEEIKTIFRHLFRVQEVLLKVNLQYIHSAAVEESQRTEPSFKLQGSYRNMNKITEKVVSAMNPAELEALISDHYRGEAQTLTSGAESNLLKLSEIMGDMDEQKLARWDEIKRTFKRIQLMGGSEDDPIARVTGSLGGLGEALSEIQTSIQDAATNKSAADQAAAQTLREEREAEPTALTSESLTESFAGLREALQAVAQRPIEVTVKSLPTVDAMLEQQVGIIENTLVPFMQIVLDDLHNAQLVNQKLDVLMQHYEQGSPPRSAAPRAQVTQPKTRVTKPQARIMTTQAPVKPRSQAASPSTEGPRTRLPSSPPKQRREPASRPQPSAPKPAKAPALSSVRKPKKVARPATTPLSINLDDDAADWDVLEQTLDDFEPFKKPRK